MYFSDIFDIMKTIPIVNIQQFEQEEPLKDFYSNTLNKHLKANSDLFHIPHKHDFFLCVIFTEGTGVHEIDFNSYQVQPGSIFFLKPGQTHYWKFDKTPKGYIFFHTKDFYNLYFSDRKLEQFPFYYSIKNPPNLTLSIPEISPLVLFFHQLDTEYHLTLPYKKQKLASLVNIIYIELSRHYTASENTKETTSSTYLKTLATLENTIETYYKTEKSATFYADKLNVSSKHLNRITKTTLNKTTTDLISERVILESKRLIVHSDNTLASIAEILGFEDYAYFSKVFKSKTKTSPLDFKKSYQ